MFAQSDTSSFGLALPGQVDDLVKPRLPVKRCLFGMSTPDKQAENFRVQENRLREQENRSMNDFMGKWGFDVSLGKPVQNSRFEYVQVGPNDNIPDFYLKTYATGKPRPVPSSRRERPYPELNNCNNRSSSQFALRRSLKRGLTSQHEDDENSSVLDCLASRVRVDAQSLLTTPKPLRPSSPLPSPSNNQRRRQSIDLKTSNSDTSSSTLSTLEFRSPNVSSSNSSGFTTVSNESLKQQCITDHFQVKRPRALSKSLPRT